MTTISGALPISTSTYDAVAPASSSYAGASYGQSRVAVALASDAGLIASIGGGVGVTTYSAAGLLSSLTQAGAAPSSGDGSEGPSLDQALVASLTPQQGEASLYSVSGGLQNTYTDTSASFASILKDNPAFARTVITDSFNQGIIGTLSTLA